MGTSSIFFLLLASTSRTTENTYPPKDVALVWAAEVVDFAASFRERGVVEFGHQRRRGGGEKMEVKGRVEAEGPSPGKLGEPVWLPSLLTPLVSLSSPH